MTDRMRQISQNPSFAASSSYTPQQLVEILIIDDGSTDDTAKIGKELANEYTEVKYIHQENKGHGGAINTGLANATGEYVKVVDSDDWVDEHSLLMLLNQIAKHCESEQNNPDVYVTNFIYEKTGKKRKMAMRYRRTFPKDEIIDWSHTKHLNVGTYLAMHSLTYKLSVVKESGLVMPEHTFYVDNIYAFIPLGSCKTLYYLDVDLYRYYIGREDQSVQMNTMIKRIDQQYKVNYIMANWLENQIKPHQLPVKLQKYLLNYFEVITIISSIVAILSQSEENLQKKRELWSDIESNNPRTYKYLKKRTLYKLISLPKALVFIPKTAYAIFRKIYGFN